MFAARVSTRAVAVVIDGAVVGGPVVAIPPGAGIQQRGQGADVRAMMAHRPNMAPPREQTTGNIGGQRVESTRFVGV